jgi:prepilin-type N-terminal cleavage/methylation domain-containing protein
MLTRRGVTLIELIVAMTVGGIALALIAVISVRQQRLYADVADRAALSGQLRQASAVLPIELRGASAVAGDIREARDTAIELRSSIATAVVCDTLAGSIALSPAIAGATAFAGYLTAIAAGDTAWVLFSQRFDGHLDSLSRLQRVVARARAMRCARPTIECNGARGCARCASSRAAGTDGQSHRICAARHTCRALQPIPRRRRPVVPRPP